MSPEPPKREYDIVEASFEVSEPDAPATDDEEKRRQDAALASTFDPALAKSGKTDEEIDKQKHDEALLVGGAAIVGAVIVAHELHEHQHDGDTTPQHDMSDSHDGHHDGGDSH